MDEAGQLSAEQRARMQIDRQLTEAGWSVQNRTELNLFAGQGIAVREVIMKRGHGRADYLCGARVWSAESSTAAHSRVAMSQWQTGGAPNDPGRA